MCICHTLIVWAWFLWSRFQTTSHVVLVRPGGDRRSCACESGSGAGAILYVTGQTWRRSMCEKDRARAEWAMSRPSVIVLESEDGNKETLHQSKPKAKNLTDTRMTLHSSLSETLQNTAFTAISHSQHLYSIYTLHVDINLHISGYSSARGILCACIFLV